MPCSASVLRSLVVWTIRSGQYNLRLKNSMSGFDDQVAVVGDWLPSPTSIFSSIVNNDATIFRSNIEHVHEPVLLGSEGHNALENAAQNSIVEDSLGAYEASDWNSLAEPKLGSGKCLKERIAARAGFNAPRLNTESIRPADLSRNLDVRSQYFTIPPGLSPTTLLDSPVFLSNSLVISCSKMKFSCNC